MKRNSGKLTGWLTGGTSDQPIDVPDEAVAVEPEENSPINLDDIPELDATPNKDPYPGNLDRRNKDGDDGLFVTGSSDSDEDSVPEEIRPARRRKDRAVEQSAEDSAADNKKKLKLSTSYEGFSIYGRILCLVVKRRGPKLSGAPLATGQHMMESWISTQAAQEQAQADDDDG